MKIALIGYGKMGHAIEKISLERGHQIVCTVDIANASDIESEAFRSADVAIEFTTPATAFSNCTKALAQCVKVVSGSTGWTEHLPQIKSMVETSGGGFFYTSNYSIGVNVLFAVNKYLAKIMDGFGQYDVAMREIHHIHKLDHPSGTAITLADGIISNMSRKSTWSEDASAPADALKITSERTGEVPGTHIIEYTSSVDKITISHEAFSREGFALGAVVAAEWLKDRSGFFGMNDMLDL